MPTDSTGDLKNLTVLVTRPLHQTEELCALLNAAGAETINFPVLEIVPVQDSSALSVIIEGLDDVDIAIFVSANAVEQGDSLVRQLRGGWPSGLQLAVVGRSSARALTRAGLKVSICPERDFNSESLLALPEMKQVEDKSIVIFRGHGGRETLATELRRRGARVDYAEVYARRCPQTDFGQLQQDGRLERISAIIVASNESLQNLYDLAGERYRDWLLRTPLAVISQRTAELARQLGFHRYCIANEADNRALLAAVRQCCVVVASENGVESGHDR